MRSSLGPRHVHRDMCTGMCLDMCTDMCVDTCTDMYAAMCTDMCLGISLHNVGTRTDVCRRKRRRWPPRVLVSYTVMAYIVMAYIVMTCVVMAYIVMAYIGESADDA